jgi:ATP-dependent Clp protease ATP-binding subunit ClpA
MFERFSAGSIRAIMKAQEKARKLSLSSIDMDLVLYGIIAENKNALVKNDDQIEAKITKLAASLETKYSAFSKLENWSSLEIPFTANVETVFKNAKDLSKKLAADTVAPEHIFYQLLFDPTVRNLLTSHEIRPADLFFGSLPNATYSPEVVEFELNFIRNEMAAKKDSPDVQIKTGAQAHEQNQIRSAESQSASEKPRSIDQWFTEDAIAVVAKAEDLARSSSSNLIELNHLLSASIPACDWLPPAIISRVGAALEDPGKTATRAKTKTKLLFSEEVSAVFIKAHTEAVQRGCTSIGAEHLLLASLRSIVDGSVQSKNLKAAVGSDLFAEASVALSRHLHKRVETRERETIEPLVVSKFKINATSRFVTTIKRAIELGLNSKDQSVNTRHMLRALVESARISEVGFLESRGMALAFIEDEEDCKNTGAKSALTVADINLDKLKAITKCASEHAQRLGSNRLDINHFGLALLDKKDHEVELVLEALGGAHSHASLKRRLEWCLFYQKFQSGYKAEAGQVINLRAIEKLYSDS